MERRLEKNGYIIPARKTEHISCLGTFQPFQN